MEFEVATEMGHRAPSDLEVLGCQCYLRPWCGSNAI